MEKAALLKLKRADVQKLAKRAGLKANRKTAAMVDDLVAKYHPLLVPYMDAIPPASEQEAISRKLYRRQGIQPKATAPSREVMCRSPRKAAEKAPVVANHRARRLGTRVGQNVQAEQHAEKIPEKTRRVQKIRLPLEQSLFAKQKPEAEEALAGRGRTTPVSEHGDTDDEMDEVEEMTSREVFSSDLPVISPRPSGEGRTRLGKRPMDTLDSQEEPPLKRPRKESS